MQPEEVTRILNLPLAQELMASAIPARIAYTGLDGFPRVVPVAFHWDGSRIVVCTTTNARKVPALRADPKVALTVDTTGFPPNVLLVRGSVRTEVVDGIPSEYLEGSRKLVTAEKWEEWEAGVRALYDRMVRITVTPEWAKLLDFDTTIPSNVQELVEQRMRA